MNIVTEQRKQTLDLTLKNKALNFNLRNKFLLHFKNKNYLQLVEYLINDEEDFCLEPNKFHNVDPRAVKRLNSTFKSVYNNTGSTSVYLMVNFIEWKNLYSKYTAPLLLIPLTIYKKSCYEKNKMIEKYFISYSGEEITVNIVLQEKLKSFGIELPDFTGEYTSYFEEVERILKNEMEVKMIKKTCIGSLLYNSGTLYKDYNQEAWPTSFEDNDMIKYISSPPPSVLPKLVASNGELPKVVCSADKSQMLAIENALNGKSFVMYGPPGTGKSQTIVNIMAGLISQNKRVLFVSEKESAIEVIKNRMNELGLGIFCLDLHDPKKTTKKIIEQIRLREQLNTYEPEFIKDKVAFDNKLKAIDKDLLFSFTVLNEKINGIPFNDLLKNYNLSEVKDPAIKNELDSFIKTKLSLPVLEKIMKNSTKTIKEFSTNFISFIKNEIEFNIKDSRYLPHLIVCDDGSSFEDCSYMAKINYDLINHDIAKKQRFQPLPRFINYASFYLRNSIPIWMMSPITVSKLVMKQSEFFDVLIMDEASQIYFENILGCVLRAKQVIVVGDSKQMSPNNILSNKSGESALDFFEKYLPAISLNVHYRSDSKSLINFSNKTYYGNKLNVLPSVSMDCKVFNHQVENGYYTLLTNKEEAKQVVEFLKSKFLQYSTIPEKEWDTIGIVSINTRQQELIEDLINIELTKNERFLDVYLRITASSSFFIKSLETVQGDERDIIIVSMTYGINPHANKIYQRFRQFNTTFGWKRLNVLASRAKKEMHVFKSISSSDVTTSKSSRKSVVDFKNFLKMVETPFVEPKTNGTSLSTIFNQLGYEVSFDIGKKDYKIDVGVIYENKYICGVLFNKTSKGLVESYESMVVKDTLTRKGWNIYEMDLIELYKHPKEEILKLKKFIQSDCIGK